MKPITREEKFMATAAGEYDGELPTPITRSDQYWVKIIECINSSGATSEQIDAAIADYLNSHDADIVTEQELSDALSENIPQPMTDSEIETAFEQATGENVPVSSFITREEITEVLNG